MKPTKAPIFAPVKFCGVAMAVPVPRRQAAGTPKNHIQNKIL